MFVMLGAFHTSTIVFSIWKWVDTALIGARDANAANGNINLFILYREGSD